MSNTEAVRIWEGADLLVDFTGVAPAPTGLATLDELDSAWEAVGIITQDGGISQSDTIESTEHFGYGNVFVRESFGKQVSTFTFAAMEDNDVVFRLSNPGSDSATVGGVTERTIKPMRPALAIAQCILLLSDGNYSKLRWLPKVQFSKNGESQTSDNAPSTTPFQGKILTKTVSGVLISGKEWTNAPGAEVSA